jgi:hypothetical protein
MLIHDLVILRRLYFFIHRTAKTVPIAKQQPTHSAKKDEKLLKENVRILDYRKTLADRE